MKAIALILCCFTLLLPSSVRADIFRWDNGQLIPGTEGITPGPGVQLDYYFLEYASLEFMDLSSASFVESNLAHALFEKANLMAANFEGANLQSARLRQAKLEGANLQGSHIQFAHLTDVTNSGFTKEQLYSTASYKAYDLRGVVFGITARTQLPNDLAGWSFQNQNLTGANFDSATLNGANFTGAILAGARFPLADRFGFSKEMLYSSASYQTQQLPRIDLFNSELTDWDFSHQNLINANFSSATLTNANFSFADTRAAQLNLTGTIATNTIRTDGRVNSLILAAGDDLVVQNHALAVLIHDAMIVADEAALKLRFDSAPWSSVISFEDSTPVQLGGTLDLDFAAGTDIAAQVGRTFHIFDWTGVSPTGAFTVASQFPWDVSQLYSTGEVTLLLPGDTNGDQAVTLEDLNNVRINFGGAGLGDTNSDGVVDLVDLNNVRNFFGASSPQAVPEPAGWMLFSVMAASTCACSLFRHRRRTP